MKVLILNGHDNYGNGGASSPIYGSEQKLTRDFSSILAEQLTARGVDVTIFNPQYTDKSMYTTLYYGGTFDFTKYDSVIELHFNAGVADYNGNSKLTGTEILVHKNMTDIAAPTQILQKLAAYGLRSRGLKRRSDLLVMGHCFSQSVPHYLWEICFIDDDDDMKYFMKNKVQLAKIFAENFSMEFDSYGSYYGYVVTDDGTSLNMRSEMKFDPGNIIGQIPNFTLVKVSPVDFINTTWVKATYNGVTGYVVKKYIVQKKTGTVNTGSGKERLRIRKAPSIHSEIVGYLTNKSGVNIYNTVKTENEGTWYLIGNDGIISGYVYAEYVTLN